jgi:hypothetical protein
VGKHDKHLPRRDLNKATDDKGIDPAFLKQVTHAQGQQTKQDAKDAKAGK